VESGLKPYDIVPLVPILEQAGAVVSNWQGGPMLDGGSVVAAAGPELHAAALELLNR
jgi:fructose-1,6-bisphosphatase/inositol monophosphatase family enzyme